MNKKIIIFCLIGKGDFNAVPLHPYIYLSMIHSRLQILLVSQEFTTSDLTDLMETANRPIRRSLQCVHNYPILSMNISLESRNSRSWVCSSSRSRRVIDVDGPWPQSKQWCFDNLQESEHILKEGLDGWCPQLLTLLLRMFIFLQRHDYEQFCCLGLVWSVVEALKPQQIQLYCVSAVVVF